MRHALIFSEAAIAVNVNRVNKKEATKSQKVSHGIIIPEEFGVKCVASKIKAI